MKELSTIEGTIGKMIREHLTEINAATSQQQLVTICRTMLVNSNNKDKDSFLSLVQNKRGYAAALKYIYDYMLKGDGLGAL